MMVSGGRKNDSLSKSKVDSCGVCSLKVKANSVLCGKWIHGRCGEVKRVTATFQKNSCCKNYEGNIGKAVEQEEMYVMKWKQ